ncbi:hypothetical protein PBDP_5184 [Pseudomonas sp. St290]|nr:hypothetical protein PBDP_5184 [Pseudomonas sp. St290]
MAHLKNLTAHRSEVSTTKKALLSKTFLHTWGKRGPLLPHLNNIQSPIRQQFTHLNNLQNTQRKMSS